MIGLDKNRIVLDAIDAGHGDAFLVRYYDSANLIPHLILIDGGPKSANDPRDNLNANAPAPERKSGITFVPYEKTIVPWLQKVQINLKLQNRLGSRNTDTKTVLDLVVCTHIDDDHIAGIDRLYDCLANSHKCADGGGEVEANELWFNSFSAMMDGVDLDEAFKTAKVMEALSVGQGETLTANADKCGAKINPDIAGNLIVAGHSSEKKFGPMRILVTNPDLKSLKKLAKKWKDEAPPIHEALKAGLEPPLDRSVPNLSSIVMALTWGKRSILMTGDQLGLDVLKGLKSVRYPETNGVYRFDIVKVPHHGSVANVQREFVEAVHADVYVFSANGKDMNPDPPVLEHFGNAAQAGRKFTMVFTNGNLSFEVKKKQSTPRIGDKEVRTLDEALAALAVTYPAFSENVRVLKRDPTVEAISVGLPEEGPVEFSGFLVQL